MARKNRMSIPDGTYHITSRLMNRERWFSDPQLKDEIVEWLYGIAAFSRVELLSWCIMDNHFHILVHVPEVPERYRLYPDAPPASYAFGMRPPECTPPLWSAVDGDSPTGTPPLWSAVDGDSPTGTGVDGDGADGDGADGDSPSRPRTEGDCSIRSEPSRRPTRPSTDFMLDDEEMLSRLEWLYGSSKRANALRKAWAEMRAHGNGAAVDAIKERYCRRMYNVSQFTKTLKERIAQVVNRRTHHVGHVFEGRFYSGLVERDQAVATMMSLYIDFNPHKAGLVKGGESYTWSSFGQACGSGPHAAECRAAYERLYGCKWAEARQLILEAFAARLPQVDNLYQRLESGGIRLKPAELVHLRVPALSRGAFIGRSILFGKASTAWLTARFPHPSFRSLAWLACAVEWPRRVA